MTATPDMFMPPLHELQREVRRIARSQIKNVEYNPRKITQAARVKLEELLVNFGLVSSLTWNASNGNLVGGHQRLQILDALSESPEYSLDVSVVELDDAREKALNLALNARGAQGEFDAEKVDAILAEIEGKIELDIADLVAEQQRELKKLTTSKKEKKKTSPPINAAFEIVIRCTDEEDQRKSFEKLVEQGYKCRVLIL